MLTREEAEAALGELVAELAQREHRSKIYIVGGAALMLGFGARDATKDIDAVITPSQRNHAGRDRDCASTKSHGRLAEYCGRDVRASVAR